MGTHDRRGAHHSESTQDLPAVEDAPAGLRNSDVAKPRASKRNKVVAGVVAAGAFAAVGAPFALNSGQGIDPAASQGNLAAAAQPAPNVLPNQHDAQRIAQEQQLQKAKQDAERQQQENAERQAREAMQRHQAQQEQAQKQAEQAQQKAEQQRQAVQQQAAKKRAFAAKHDDSNQQAAKKDDAGQQDTRKAAPASGQGSSSGGGKSDDSASKPVPKSGYVKPAEGRKTSEFGNRSGSSHKGVDIANSKGTPIRAVTGGKVISAGQASGFGQWVRLMHGDGTVTVYGHIDSYSVKQGQQVNAGDEIAKMGSRGQSTGTHLHFQVQPGGANGKPVDPVPWLKQRGVSL